MKLGLRGLFYRRTDTDIAMGKTWVSQRVARSTPVLAGVLLLRMLVNGIGYPGQPRPILEHFQNIRRAEILDAIRGRVAQMLEQTRRDEVRDVVRLAAQHPGDLLGRQPPGQLPQQRQELLLIFFHAALNMFSHSELPVTRRAQKRTDFSSHGAIDSMAQLHTAFNFRRNSVPLVRNAHGACPTFRKVADSYSLFQPMDRTRWC